MRVVRAVLLLTTGCSHDFAFLDARETGPTDSGVEAADDAQSDDSGDDTGADAGGTCKVSGTNANCCGLYSGGCNAVTNQGCSNGQKCVENGTATFTCQGIGTGGQGAVCTFATQCKVGYACFGNGGVYHCQKLCCSFDDCVGTGTSMCVPFVNEPYGKCQ